MIDALSALRLPPVPNGAVDLAKLASVNANRPLGAAQELPNLGSVGAVQPQGLASGRSFSDFIGTMVQDVSAKQTAATEAVEGVIGGQEVPLHQAMISVEEASVSFQLMVEVRNKMLESYQELMRMQI